MTYREGGKELHEGSLETRSELHCFTEAKFQMFKLPCQRHTFFVQKKDRSTCVVPLAMTL